MTNNYEGNISEKKETELFSLKQTRLDFPELARDEQTQLEINLNNLLHGLNLMPKRKIGESSDGVPSHVTCAFCGLSGVHYSDSCPEMTDGDARWQFVRERDCARTA